MRRFERLPVPEILLTHKDQITSHYIKQRTGNSSHTFKWPQRENTRLNQSLLPTLEMQTQDHCSYCDGFPLKKSDYTIDHFKPKSDPAYYHLVVEWTNLYLCCGACQQRKEKYSDLLLRPDDMDYSFSEYFDYNFEEHKLLPNPAKPIENQERATVTIELFDLNHTGQKKSRQFMFKAYQNDETKITDDLGYRFMFDIVK